MIIKSLDIFHLNLKPDVFFNPLQESVNFVFLAPAKHEIIDTGANY